MSKTLPTCGTCGNGQLKRKKKYRMSGPVVVIGYLILLPSILGMLFGTLTLFATGGAASETNAQLKAELTNQIVEAGISEEIARKVVESEPLTEAEQNSLTAEQRDALANARLSHSAGQIGAGGATVVAGGVGIFLILTSFIGGLLGWLLIMKKKVLQCTSCSAIVAAS